MTNKREARERQTRRIAIIASVVLHLVIILGIIHSTGKSSGLELIEQAKEHSQDHVKADAKV